MRTKTAVFSSGCILLLLAATTLSCAQQRPVSLHSRTLIAQYYCVNPDEHDDPAGAYFFTPSIGGNGEAVVRYTPGRSRFSFETGVCVWLWNYRAALDAGHTRTQYYGWAAGRNGASVGLPIRAGLEAARGLSLSAGIVLLKNLSGRSSSRHGISSALNGEQLEGEAFSVGRSYTSLAFDLTVGIQLSRRFEAVVRGGLDTKAYPAVQMQHRITRDGAVRTYGFTGAPKLAFAAVGVGFKIW